jgi:predicted metal-dependent hydrolase
MPTRNRTVTQGGRAKAYRPLPLAERRARLEEGIAAYGRGDFFLAHELLEPAWMGTSDLPERDLIQGLIKLAAAYVHAARGNPAGVRKNLAGALERLRAGAAASTLLGVDAATLVGAIERDLASGDIPGAPPILRLSG